MNTTSTSTYSASATALLGAGGLLLVLGVLLLDTHSVLAVTAMVVGAVCSVASALAGRARRAATTEQGSSTSA